MNTNVKNSGKAARLLGFLGIGLCGLCCALPIIGMVGVAGLLSAIAMHAEQIGLVILIGSIAAFAITFYQKRKSPTCKID
jgi:hypothetical protein